MEAQCTEKTSWAEIETDNGTWYVPADLDDFTGKGWKERASRYVEGTVQSVKIRRGYGTRRSAPGYLDCTEWDFHASLKSARAAMREMREEDSEYDDE